MRITDYFQRFELNLEALAKLSEEDRKVLAYKMMEARRRIFGNAYDMLESSEAVEGVPCSLIVSRKKEKYSQSRVIELLELHLASEDVSVFVPKEHYSDSTRLDKIL